MKAWRVGILCVFVAIVGAIAVCHPSWLASNAFLEGLMSHELIALLVVILTITFASVANIHLAISRMVRQAPNPTAASRGASDVRREINSNAWTIFISFLVAVVALLAKGSWKEDIHVVAIAHAVGLSVLLLNILVLHDIYRSIFALASVDAPLPSSEDGPSPHTDD